MAARLGFALGPLGRSSETRESLVDGFCGTLGWTPSIASQCAGENQSLAPVSFMTTLSMTRVICSYSTCKRDLPRNFGQ